MAVNLPRAVQFQFIRQVRRVEVDHCSLRPHSVPLCPLASPHENFFAVLPTHSPSYRFPRGKFTTSATVVIINERIELLAISSLEVNSNSTFNELDRIANICKYVGTRILSAFFVR